MNKRHRSANGLTLAGMSTAISVVLLYAASMLPTSRLALLFMSSLCIWIPLNGQRGLPFALLTYIATSAVSFLIVPDKLYPIAYLMFFGCYGMIKLQLDRLIPNRFLAAAAKLITCDLLTALALLLALLLLGLDISTLLPEIPLWVIVSLLQLIFLAYELLYSLCARAFDSTIRSRITPKQ